MLIKITKIKKLSKYLNKNMHSLMDYQSINHKEMAESVFSTFATYEGKTGGEIFNCA
jgi:hypothetical protein